MSSEKVAVMFVVGATPVAFALGTVLVTLGGVVSVGGGSGGGVVSGNPSALRQPSPEQSLKASRRACSSE